MVTKGGKERTQRGSLAQEQNFSGLLGQEFFKDWQQSIQEMVSTGLQQLQRGMAQLYVQMKDYREYFHNQTKVSLESIDESRM